MICCKEKCDNEVHDPRVAFCPAHLDRHYQRTLDIPNQREKGISNAPYGKPLKLNWYRVVCGCGATFIARFLAAEVAAKKKCPECGGKRRVKQVKMGAKRYEARDRERRGETSDA